MTPCASGQAVALTWKTARPIEEQQALCGKGGEWRGRRPGQGLSGLGPCSCSADVPGGGRLGFVWQQQVFDPVLGSVLAGAYPKIQTRPGDLLVLNAGLDPILDLFKRGFGKKKSRGADGTLVVWLVLGLSACLLYTSDAADE